MRETEWLLTDSEIVKDVRVDRERDGKIRERIVLSKISVCDLKFQHDVVDTFWCFQVFVLFIFLRDSSNSFARISVNQYKTGTS